MNSYEQRYEQTEVMNSYEEGSTSGSLQGFEGA